MGEDLNDDLFSAVPVSRCRMNEYSAVGDPLRLIQFVTYERLIHRSAVTSHRCTREQHTKRVRVL